MNAPMSISRLTAYLGIFFVTTVVVAILTPTTDAISMAIPWLITSVIFCGLFELGWFLYRRNQK